jgi:glycosyltransferase involved in cell wall biosynthesis
MVTPLPLFDKKYLNRLYAGKRRGILRIIAAYFKRLNGIVRANQFDLIWIEKELFPWIPPWFESYLVHTKIPVVVDYDDAIFHHYDLNHHYIVRRLLGRKIDRVMQQACLVIAGNRYLARRADQAGARWIERIPSVIDLARYRILPRRTDRPFIVGWVGSPTTAKYLKLVEPALIEFCQKRDARLVVVGAGNPDLSPQIPVDLRPWSEASEVADIAEFDVGIMPLTDTPWARGKCGYKLIQYMACGRPVVASRISADLDIIQAGETGFLAHSTAQWFDRLDILYKDRKFGARMGKKGREIVAARFSLQVAAPRLASLLIRAGQTRYRGYDQ